MNNWGRQREVEKPKTLADLGRRGEDVLANLQEKRAWLVAVTGPTPVVAAIDAAIDYVSLVRRVAEQEAR